MSQTTTLPPQFAALGPYLSWALPTTTERMRERLSRSKGEVMAFHAATAPHIDAIVEYLNQFPLDAIPAEAQGLFDLMMAIGETAIYAEWLEGAGEPPIAPGMGKRIQMLWEPAAR